MALTSLNGQLFIPNSFGNMSGAPTFTASAIDAIDEGVAFMVKAPKTGNITKVLWASRTTTTGATITTRLETWDETTTPAQPSGTLFHANASGTLAVANGDDNVSLLTTLAGNVPVSKGDKLAVVTKQPGASAGSMQVASFAQEVANYPYVLLNTGVSPAVSWAAVASTPIVAFEYDDGSYAWIPRCFPCHAFTTNTWNSGSTPDEYALRFKLPVPYKVGGFWAWIDPDADFDVVLYDSDGVTPLVTVAIDKDAARTATGNIFYMQFPSEYTMTANTFYRLSIKPGASSVSLYDFSVRSVAVLDSWEGGQNFHLSTAKDPAAEGDWTNFNSGTFRRPFMGIGLSALDNGSGGGVMIPGGMVGGMRG